MAGLWESHYWLFTGRDWDQDKENIPCNLGFCDHAHGSTSDSNGKFNIKYALIMWAIVCSPLIAGIIFFLFCAWMGWLN